MDKRTILNFVITQGIIFLCFAVTYVIFELKWPLTILIICECFYLLILGITLYRKCRYSSYFISKRATGQVETNLSVTDLNDWVKFTNSFNEDIPAKEEKKEIYNKIETLEQADKEWQRERRTERGSMQYDRILSNWKTYIAVCSINKRISPVRKCELEIICFMLRNNASIKHQETIINLCSCNGRTREIAMEAIDQLLIKRIIIIALEGSLDYYRINLGWNIVRDIEKEKQDLLTQTTLVEKRAIHEEKAPRQTLSQTKIEKHEAEEIAKSVSYYRKQIEDQLIICLEKETKPLSILEMMANYRDLGTINQLSLEEIMKKLVQKGQAVIAEDEYPVKYRLTKKIV